MCEGPVGQPHRQVRQAGPAGPDGIADVGRHRDRGDIVGKHKVQDRQVMRCEVPEDVDVGLHQAKVDPDRVDELDVAYFPAADELADALNGRGVAVRVVAHEHQARAEGERGQLLSLGDRRGQRFLHQYVLAGLQGAAHKIEVGRGGCRDGHRSDGRVAKDRIVGVGGPDSGVRAEDGPGPFDLEIAQPVQPERRRSQRGTDEIRPPVASTDHRQPDRHAEFLLLASGSHRYQSFVAPHTCHPTRHVRLQLHAKLIARGRHIARKVSAHAFPHCPWSPRTAGRAPVTPTCRVVSPREVGWSM